MSKKNEKNPNEDLRAHGYVKTTRVGADLTYKPKEPIFATPEQRLIVDKYRITGNELKEILKEFGSTQTEFASIIGKSNDSVHLMIKAKYRRIRFRYAQKLEEFVGEELYLTTLENLRTKNVKREAQDVGNKNEKSN